MITVEQINIMFVERAKGQQSPLRKQLRLIADLAHYQPVPSIPTPSQGFNYTLSQQRYSEFETPRAVKKEKSSSWVRSEDLRLSTILETQNFNHVFPKINPSARKESPRKKVKHLPTIFHKDRQDTEATRERSLTHDTPMTNEQERFISMQSHRDNEQSLSISRKQPLKNQKNIQRYQQKSHLQISLLEQAESQEDDEFEKDAVPGPGTYTYSYSDFDQKSIGRRSTKASSFISQSTRFPKIKPTIEESEVPNNSIQESKEKKRNEWIKARKSRRKLVPFNSKSPRIFQADQAAKNKSPGPEDYNPRCGIQEELIKKIQRNFRGNFGSNQQRFKSFQESSQILGPGSYQIPIPEGPIIGQNFYFKSQLQRF